MSKLGLLLWGCMFAWIPFLTWALPSTPRSSTSRTLLEKSKTTSSLSQVKNPRWFEHSVSTTAVYAAPFLKHHMPMPASLSAALNSSQRGQASDLNPSVTRRDNGQTVSGSSGEYVFPVNIGTPSQTLYLLFDTGSGDFWAWSWLSTVFNNFLRLRSQNISLVLASTDSSSFIVPDTLTTGHTIYNATASTSSLVFPGQSFDVGYAAGSASGAVWTDTLWIDTIGVGNNPIECAENVEGDYTSLPAIDGVFGLSTWVDDQETPTPQQTWLNFVLPQLPSQVFTVALVQNGVGTIDFGFINATKYSGSIVYVLVETIPYALESGEWSFFSSGYAVGSGTFNATSIPVLTDTGTNVALLPESMTLNYYSQVSGAYQQSDGSWAFPCASKLPSLTLGIGSSQAVISGEFMVFAALDDSDDCYGAIQATSEEGFVYFGTPFFEALFVVQDYGEKRLGFAARTFL